MATISGTAQVGSVLTAGALTPSGATANYQWQISDTVDGSYVSISGATGATYTPVTGNIDKFIKVTAVGTGIYSGTHISSPTSAVVAAAPIDLSGIGSITGTIRVGSVLTAGAVTPSGATVNYQWMISDTSDGSGVSIDGATNSNYTLQPTDLGKYLMVMATGTGGYTGSVTSTTTTIVEATL